MLKRLRRRVAAVKEILTTEEQLVLFCLFVSFACVCVCVFFFLFFCRYLQKLRLFQSVFFAALREAETQGMVNPSDLVKIFGNWDDVVM